MNKTLYIVNPISGKGKARKAIPLINQYCTERNVDYKIIETEYRKHATEIVRHNSKDYDIIVSVGGDGTLNEVINGFESGSHVILGVLPVGSGNDFTKNIGFTNNIKDDISIIHNTDLHEVISVDLGHIEFYDFYNNDEAIKHKFINNLGIGFDAHVGFINQSNKVFSGLVSYIYAVFKALLNYQMIDAEIKMLENIISGERLMISIGNGISSGGGFYLNPKAIINDGVLDVSIFDKITRRRLLTALPMALLNKLEKVPEAKLYVTNNSMDIKLKIPYYAHCDGEIITEKLTSAVVTVMKDELRVIKKKGN